MGILELATIVLIILKVTGIITLGWLFVFMPLIVALALYFVWFVIFGVIFGVSIKTIRKAMK